MSTKDEREKCKLSFDYWMKKCVRVKDNTLKEALMKGPEEFYRNMKIEQDKRFEFALRHLIPCPIVGKVTKGKLRWRGIYLKMPPPETPELVRKEDGNFILKCTFRFPILCANQSKSGKRQSYEINLNFCPEHMSLYQYWQSQENTFAFGVAARRDGKYNVGGIINQIKKG